MLSLQSPNILRQPFRLSLICLLATGALFYALPGRVHSLNRNSSQNLAPELNTGALNIARTGHTATLLQNGKVLVAGGRDGASIYNTAVIALEVVDHTPVTGSKISAVL